MVVSRHWWSQWACLSLCLAALATPSRADEPPVDDAASVETEVDNAVVQATVDVPIDATAKVDGAEPDSTGAKATHKQSSLININAPGLSEASVQCFCLMGNDLLLAGCTGAASEIRVFDKGGKYVKSIELPVAPEAINVASDGTILVAGEGELLRLSADGQVTAQVESPHAAAIRESKAQIREQTIEQHKQQAQMLPQMLEAYDNAIKGLDEQIKALESKDDAQAELDAAKQMLDTYKSAKEQLAEQFGEQGEAGKELTEEQIDELVKSAMQYKTKVASISASGDAVFIACNMPVGHGYAVWRMTPEFTDGEKIVTDLSGCCGQMDVQVNEDGVFVAENSRKRVRRFDASGKSICDWGKSSEGVDGFGSCCNPMNLAFGADGVVYTAEDTTGRIKRYSPDGELLSVVGAADVVPGCKKVSIGVDATGDRVYMLDITRNNVAVLSRVLPDPTGPIADAEEPAGQGGGLLRLLGIGS